MNVLCKVCEKVKYAIDFQMDTRKDAEQKIHQNNFLQNMQKFRLMHTKINRECNSSYFGNVTNGKDIVSLVTDRQQKYVRPG